VRLEGEDVLILSEHDILARVAAAPAKKAAAKKTTAKKAAKK
jgi:hypothetical protein